jgi:hypothetical protein
VAALAWLLIPLAGAVAAAVWARWAARHRSTGDGASLAGYERFRAAMETVGMDAERPGEEDSPRGPVAGPVP